MSAANNGGPAFPGEHEIQKAGYSTKEREPFPGMSLRDYFAAQAMQACATGHFSHYGHDSHWTVEGMSSHAYELADAMLKARKA